MLCKLFGPRAFVHGFDLDPQRRGGRNVIGFIADWIHIDIFSSLSRVLVEVSTGERWRNPRSSIVSSLAFDPPVGENDSTFFS